ncbi:hypothetical protein BZA05DRAFT_89990 [Tricharina praecox]|uniref:uncharacterized protein n=1 Tax=Tricharina praecox TaxID=43433 RepID=UPI00221FEEEB|nr:uncharacterized protein BZA05DRAFT_89990 [Tricharina praecox]KAI5848910.1 hypothetical protein BZA05DRAFT_89990 [Tricharina praecox]
MSSHHYSHRAPPPPSSRPRAPSYTGLPHDHHVLPKPHHHHHHAHTPSSGSPGDNSYIPYTASSPTSSYGRAASISTSSISSSSYAGSAEDESLAGGEVDMVDMLTQRLAGAFDPLQLDRSLAMQAQTSGMLNSKTRELIALQEEAQARLAETRRSFVEGMKIAKEVKADLDYVHRKVRVLKQKTERKYPVEYNMARDRIPPPS